MRLILTVACCGLLVWGCPPPPPPEPPAVGEPLDGLSEEQLARFGEGEAVFGRSFAPEEGLGPLFNAEGCAVCHSQPVAGGSSDIAEVHATRFVEPDLCDPLFAEGGPVIQQRATPLLQAQGIDREEVPASATGQALRTSPPLFGFGLVDAIPDAAILASEDADDGDGDGISGRANRFIDGRLGRFGRKAFIPTLADFNGGAFPIEQGLTTPLSPEEETINGQPVPPETDPVPDPEVELAQIGAATDFTRFLAPPPQVVAATKAQRRRIDRGRKVFSKIGCADCHVPSMTTGPSDVPALDRKEVFLYSDLLLHDMGDELADICLGLATPSEFRTELLMGLRFRQQFLHDGSAASVEAAIERHGGEAAPSRQAFAELGGKKRAALLEFLDSI